MIEARYWVDAALIRGVASAETNDRPGKIAGRVSC